MQNTYNILIVKHGALGDVVRTSYFAKPVRLMNVGSNYEIVLYWLTAPSSFPLLRYNPYIDHVTTNYLDLIHINFDLVYSLDDEIEILECLKKLNISKTVGAFINVNGQRDYCDQSKYWFDMGLISRHGKTLADNLKKQNKYSHSEIFKKIFKTDSVDIQFYNSEFLNEKLKLSVNQITKGNFKIGINAFAGKRWESKSLSISEFKKLLLNITKIKVSDKQVYILLLGSGSDLIKYQEFLSGFHFSDNISIVNTDNNVLDFAAVVRSLDMLITSDSLCLHLAVSQKIPTVAFFSPTSADEIENVSYVRKVKSLSNDYCSYLPNADNATITSDRILEEVQEVLKYIDHD